MAPGTNPEATHRQGQLTESDEVPTLEDCRQELVSVARDHGQESARRGDPDGFEGAIQVIRDAAGSSHEFTADDVRWPLRGNELGSAFRPLTQAGEIVAVGFTTSKRPRSHGRILRIWRAS